MLGGGYGCSSSGAAMLGSLELFTIRRRWEAEEGGEAGELGGEEEEGEDGGRCWCRWG